MPALRRGLAILRALAGHAGPVPAAALARETGVPRSTTYHLLAELESAGFVVHLVTERRYALGVAAFDLGSAYLRQDPLERLAAPLLRSLAERTGHTAQLGVLHGNEVLYLHKERPPRPETLVTDAGVRLPAHLTATGRAILAHLPAPHVRALFPNAAAFVSRTGRGPRGLAELRRLLAEVRRRGWAAEDGCVTEGFASVAYPVFDHGGRPMAAIGVTWRHDCPATETVCGRTWRDLAAQARLSATEVTGRIGGRAPV